jgi:hypothetical protein
MPEDQRQHSSRQKGSRHPFSEESVLISRIFGSLPFFHGSLHALSKRFVWSATLCGVASERAVFRGRRVFSYLKCQGRRRDGVLRQGARCLSSPTVFEYPMHGEICESGYPRYTRKQGRGCFANIKSCPFAKPSAVLQIGSTILQERMGEGQSSCRTGASTSSANTLVQRPGSIQYGSHLCSEFVTTCTKVSAPECNRVETVSSEVRRQLLDVP